MELFIENEIRPNIRLLAESCLLSARQHEAEMKEIGSMKVDVTLFKKVVADHSEILQNIS